MNTIRVGEHTVEYREFHTVVVGSGAAGLNAAYSLAKLGIRDCCVLTEGVNMGTSRNTGSDKQTYYKLSLAGSAVDSPKQMTFDLFSGGCVDGDQAMVEAAYSSKCFYRLCELGVPFPHNEFGEYVGYQTDFDHSRRATSAGPLTSRLMHNCLLDAVRKENIEILNECLAGKILTKDGSVSGVLAIRRRVHEGEKRYLLIKCENLIYAVGGPAGLYRKSVYPQSQTGASGIAFEAGLIGKNLTEWQYGIASTKFRWNLSGTYQQVLPRYFSTAQDGSDERDFLAEAFADRESLLTAIFRKGYQWPFNPDHLLNSGSSCIDIMVFREIVEKSRRVFMDYRSNPVQLLNGSGQVDLAAAGREAYTYLERSNALQSTPIARLKAMNLPAYQLYLSHGIDLAAEPLEIAVCAQHNNGGLQSDGWWESNISGFYPVGEVNGSHGISRPGGSALNAGQAGSLRAAQHIYLKKQKSGISREQLLEQTGEEVSSFLDMCKKLVEKPGESTLLRDRERLQERMSKYAAHIRNYEDMKTALAEAKAQLEKFEEETVAGCENAICYALQNRDLLIAQIVYLSAMIDYCEHGGKSRGSYIIEDAAGEHTVLGMRFSLDAGKLKESVQTVRFENGEITSQWRPRREVPEGNDWFENVFNEYRRSWCAE